MRRSYQAFLVAITFACALALAPLLVEAQVPVGLLELDGNTADDDGVTGFDWVNASGQAVVGEFFNTTDPIGGLQMTQGTKDTDDVSDWVFKTVAQTTPKDDLTQVWGASATDPTPINGSSILYFASQRREASGTTSFGFWLLAGEIEINENDGNSFSDDQHLEGDTLIVVDVGGNRIEGVRLFEWQGGNGTAGSLQEIGEIGTNQANCSTAGVTNGHYNTPICGAVSADGLFFEIGINFGNLLGDRCVTSVMSTTRTSNEANASVKNFVLNDFELCKITTNKTCEVVDFDPFTATFTVAFTITVKNDGPGSFDSTAIIDWEDDNGDGFGTNDTAGSFVVSTLANGSNGFQAGETLTLDPDGDGVTGTFTTTANGGPNTARATVRNAAGTLAVSDTSPTVTCQGVDISPALFINKVCTGTVLSTQDVDGSPLSHVGIINSFTIQACNTGNLDLSVNISDATAGVSVNAIILESGFSCTSSADCTALTATNNPACLKDPNAAPGDTGVCVFTAGATANEDGPIDNTGGTATVCRFIADKYLLLSLPGGVTSAPPSDSVFTNQATVTAPVSDNPLLSADEVDMDSAMCPLCPTP